MSIESPLKAFKSPYPYIYNTTPRSLQRRTGGLLLDRIFQYFLPLAFFGYRSDAGETCWGNGKLRVCQSIKHQVHADVCSGSYQNACSRAAHQSEVCFVFGSSGVRCFCWVFRNSSVPNGAGVQDIFGTSEPTSPLDSLLSCVYNVQYFLDFVNPSCEILQFSQRTPHRKSKPHKSVGGVLIPPPPAAAGENGSCEKSARPPGAAFPAQRKGRCGLLPDSPPAAGGPGECQSPNRLPAGLGRRGS